MSDTLLNTALAFGFLGILLICDKPIRLKQGTVSVLFGCHSILHSYFVIIAWKRMYGHWPKLCKFLAGHCSHSGYPKSKLYKADKYSWYIAPEWWLYSNTIKYEKA